ncbi:MAG: bile acid:sodium symporter family protein, partial [Candidatus Hydrogenedentes bacterium]|nr:bile acid:sodium symporter family protein [Candidatus Hydrogenedentota bacterium]
LPPELAMGFIILGCCPGGTASNVIAYLAKADVALSVTMTACSTLLAIGLTPVLVGVLGGRFLPVDRWGLFLSVLKIVLVPVSAGLLVRYWLKERAQRAVEVFPAVSVLFIVLIIACVVALSGEKLPEALGVTGLLVVAHNMLGLLLGYGLAAVFRLPKNARRTVAIEVGMQNSGLGVALATKHFAHALVPLPAILFSVVHNLTGSALANLWRAAPVEGAQASGED